MFAAASAGASAAVANVSPPVHGQHIRGGWIAPGANIAHEWVYVSGDGGNNVLVYDYGQSGATQIGAITTGLSGPRCLSLDPAGRLYVANQYNATVTVYAPGTTSPSLTLTTGLQQPISAATDPRGNVWVTNDGSNPSIVIYPPGQQTPSHIITDPLIAVPAQLTFDSAGNAFFADNKTGISEFPAGSLHPVSLHLEEIIPNATNGVAVDSHSGLLFASFGKLNNRLNVYRIGRKWPLRTMAISSADGLALGGQGKQKNLFVPGSQTNAVTVYRPGHPNPLSSFKVATNYTRGVAVKAAGLP